MVVDGVKGGVTAALAAVAQGEAPGDDGEQLDLLGLPLSVAGIEAVAAIGQRRGPGRPLGSRNKRTVDWTDFLLSRYGSPLEVLAQIATRSVAELQRQLRCSALEAFQEKRHAAVALLPYLHQRQAVAVDVTNRQVVHLTIVDQAPDAGGDGVAVHIVDVLENQRVGDVPGDDVARCDVARTG